MQARWDGGLAHVLRVSNFGTAHAPTAALRQILKAITCMSDCLRKYLSVLDLYWLVFHGVLLNPDLGRLA